jgi:hypothetical protein
VNPRVSILWVFTNGLNRLLDSLLAPTPLTKRNRTQPQFSGQGGFTPVGCQSTTESADHATKDLKRENLDLFL